MAGQGLVNLETVAALRGCGERCVPRVSPCGCSRSGTAQATEPTRGGDLGMWGMARHIERTLI